MHDLAVPAITVISYLAAEIAKALSVNTKWVPVICGVVGGALGIAAQFVMPGFPSDNPLTAVAIGIVSCLAATGAHQVGRQLQTK